MTETVCIDHRYGIGLDIVGKSDQVQKLVVLITRDRYELSKDLITERLDLRNELQRILTKVFLEDDPYRIYAALGLGTDLIDIRVTIIDHGYDLRITLVKIGKRAVDRLRIGEYRSVGIIGPCLIDKSDLDKVNSGSNKPLENAHDIVVTELPVIYITAVS